MADFATGHDLGRQGHAGRGRINQGDDQFLTGSRRHQDTSGLAGGGDAGLGAAEGVAAFYRFRATVWICRVVVVVFFGGGGDQ